MLNELNIEVRSAADVVTVRQKGRVLAMEMGFGGSDLTVISTAISEVARNIVSHAHRGKVTVFETRQGRKHGICVVGSDEGSSISDSIRPVQNGFSGYNKPGADPSANTWPMDKVEVRSNDGKGTTVTMKKWLT